MNLDERLRDTRHSYERSAFGEGDANADPVEQFRLWLEEALADSEHTIEPNAMTLATVGPDGRPSARVVLLRGFDERGFVFFTNYGSRKGRELAGNGRAALVFFWASLERSVRIDGDVVKLADRESDAYFAKRPRGHRISAWASDQSAKIAGRAVVDDKMRSFEDRFEGRDVDRPPFWGGYRVAPVAIEFWQGRKNRIHDRLLYERDGAAWTIARLSP